VSNVQYSHPVFENSVENFVWIANERHDPHTWALGNWLRGFGTLSDTFNDRSYSHFDSDSHVLAQCSAVGSYFAKIS